MAAVAVVAAVAVAAAVAAAAVVVVLVVVVVAEVVVVVVVVVLVVVVSQHVDYFQLPTKSLQFSIRIGSHEAGFDPLLPGTCKGANHTSYHKGTVDKPTDKLCAQSQVMAGKLCR
jgi:hypothetical protein